MDFNAVLELFLFVYFIALGIKLISTKQMNGNMYQSYTEESLAKFAPFCGVMYLIWGAIFGVFALFTMGLLNPAWSKPVYLIGCGILILLAISLWIAQKKMLVVKQRN